MAVGIPLRLRTEGAELEASAVVNTEFESGEDEIGSRERESTAKNIWI